MKEDFKKFVRKNPNLAKYVENKKMTWQQFYELFDLYGENNSVWDSFKETGSNNGNVVNTIREFINLFKGIDLETVQNTLSSINKVIDAFKGFNTNEEHKNTQYEDNKYRYFED